MLGYVGSLVAEALAEFWLIIRPGGISYELHWESFMTSSSHYILEGSLVGIIVYLLLQKGKPIEKEEPLTEQASVVRTLRGLSWHACSADRVMANDCIDQVDEKPIGWFLQEVEELCHEWKPQPLCPPMSDRDKRRACHPVVQRYPPPPSPLPLPLHPQRLWTCHARPGPISLPIQPKLTIGLPVPRSSEGPIAQVNGKEVVNFCSSDFLGISKRGEIMVLSRPSLCPPRTCHVSLHRQGQARSRPDGLLRLLVTPRTPAKGP